MNETTKTSERALQTMNRGDVAVLSPPRLPWHPSIGEKFGVDRIAWKALVEAIYPNATSTDSVALALAYCQTRKLDVMKKMVHIVPMWRKKRKLPNGQWEKGCMVDTVWPSIAELRVTAFRTGQYAGKDEIEFGPEESRTFKIESEAEDDQTGEVTKTAREITIKFPMWGRITVHRLIGNGLIGKFVGPKLRWIEEYGRLRNTDMPNDMWAKRPYDQFEKVVEAAALRCAFPEELGNEYSSDEMDGKVIDVAPNMQAEARQAREEIPPQDTAPLQPQQQPQEHMPPEPGNPGRGYSEQEVMPPEPSEPARGPSQAFRASEAGNGFREQPTEEMPPEPGENKPSDYQWLADVEAACRTIFNDTTKAAPDLDIYHRNHVATQRNSRPPDTYKTATNIVKRMQDEMEKRAKAAAQQ